jgi:DNA end-binding protein Ku
MATQARSIASLTISFGLVAIPVKLYSATVSSERISFNLLRQKDGSRVKQQYIAVNDGKPVERAEMVKGYEFAKDQYVMFSPEELKALEDATTHAIDIGQFRSTPWIRFILTAHIIWRRTRAAPSRTHC